MDEQGEGSVLEKLLMTRTLYLQSMLACNTGAQLANHQSQCINIIQRPHQLSAATPKRTPAYSISDLGACTLPSREATGPTHSRSPMLAPCQLQKAHCIVHVWYGIKDLPGARASAAVTCRAQAFRGQETAASVQPGFWGLPGHAHAVPCTSPADQPETNPTPDTEASAVIRR